MSDILSPGLSVHLTPELTDMSGLAPNWFGLAPRRQIWDFLMINFQNVLKLKLKKSQSRSIWGQSDQFVSSPDNPDLTVTGEFSNGLSTCKVNEIVVPAIQDFHPRVRRVLFNTSLHQRFTRSGRVDSSDFPAAIDSL